MHRTAHRMSLALVALAAPAALAHPTAYVSDGDDTLYQLDLATMQTTYIGQLGVEHVGDIAALSDGTIAGQHDASPGYFLASASNASLISQAQNDASSGFLGDLDAYGDRLYDFRNGNLRLIDNNTAERTVVGGYSDIDFAKLAMINDREGYLYSTGSAGLQELYRVDFDSGTADLLWDTVDTTTILRSIDYAQGTLYAMDSNGDVLTFDETGSSFDVLGRIDLDFVGGFTVVPAPGAGGVLALAGLIAARRRRPNHEA